MAKNKKISGTKQQRVPQDDPAAEKARQRELNRAKAAATRAVVADSSSWTGKLPSTLLHEHCQKLKWEKVIFDSYHVKDGFLVNITLGQKNRKTNQIETVVFKPPFDLIKPQATALEARHFTATYTMHRIASQKNLKMLLPGPHKALWSQLDEVKTSTPKDQRPLHYAEDPFAAQREKQKLKDEKKAASAEYDKKREEIELKKLVSKVRMETIQESSDVSTNSTPQQYQRRKIRFKEILSMSKHTREISELVIRKHHGFRLEAHSDPLKKSDTKYGDIVTSLSKIGFEMAQINEALEHSNSLSSAIEWLLIHVPENDLPKMFANPNLGVNANIQAGDLKQEYVVRDITKLGYSEELIREVLTDKKEKRTTIVALTAMLAEDNSDETNKDDGDDGISIWIEEMESIKSIYENGFKSDENSCIFDLTIDKHVIQVTLWRPNNYPSALPGIALEVISGIKVPKYILLDVTRRAGQYSSSIKGDYMILSIIEWLQENFTEIRNHPSKLSTISRGVSGDIEPIVIVKPKSSGSKKKRRGRVTITSEILKMRYQQCSKTESFQAMQADRQKLPAWKKKDEIVNLIKANQIVLITGETGSGKSTQVVQFILDNIIQSNGKPPNIICTQPRRISAMGLAQRVSDERTTPLGSEIGYVIRGESKTSEFTCLRFVTSGVLLRMIQTNVEVLDEISHIVIDEVHERSLDSDFLLILLKRFCMKNPNLKVILMSATVDTKIFMNYFNNNIGFAHIEGRTFPVDDVYLDDIILWTKYIPFALQEENIVLPKDIGRVVISLKDHIENDLVTNVVSNICNNLGSSFGSILIFMPGAAEIDACIAAIEKSSLASFIYALPLHSALSPAEQRRVFVNAPKGKRKVVVSTNIAETSITIPDIVAVIDSGRVKETRYDPATNSVKLEETWASQSASTQRRGRAGRVQKGVCYKLYTSNIEQNIMPSRPKPEIMRVPLEQLYLSVKAMGIENATRFLNEALDPPNIMALEAARGLLVNAGAIDKTSDKLTPLGKHISMIPSDIRSSKLLILGAIFGCLSKSLTIVAMLALKSPFYAPKEQREEAKNAKKQFSQNGEGDLLAVAHAYEEWKTKKNISSSSAVRSWCNHNFLSFQVLCDIEGGRRQLLATLQEIGFVTSDREEEIPPQYNFKNASDMIVRAVIAASLLPNLIEIVFPEKTFKEGSSGAVEKDPEAKAIRFYDEKERVFIHPSSVLFGSSKFISDSKFLAFGSKMATSKPFISDLTPVGIYGTLFFSDSIEVDPLGAGIVLRNWIGLKCWPRVGILVKILRNLFNSILEAKFNDPMLDISTNEVLNVVYNLIEGDGRL